MKLKFTFLSICIALSSYTLAQDIHFSQPEFSPMSLSPSLTGQNGPLRFGINYRNQWPLVGASFNTTEAYADIKFGDHDPLRTGYLSLGIMLYNDMANGLGVMTNKGNLNLSYRLKIDDMNHIGVGIYAGFGQRSLADPDGKWATQYNGDVYDPALESGETFVRQSFTYGDAGFGFDYHFEQGETSMNKNDRLEINTGLALYHLNRPQYSFNNDNAEQLPIRVSYFASGVIGIKNKRNSILPGVYINYQKSAFELLYGAYFSYLIQEGSKITGFRNATTVAVGAFHRWNDAFVLKGMMEVKKFSFGVAYDINVSRLTPSSQTVGGFEFFIAYKTRYSKKYGDESTL